MLAGLKTPQMQLFQRNARGKVTLSRNETDIVGWSVDEILHGLLGVEHPTALETERRLRHLQELRRLETPPSVESDTASYDSLPQTAPQTPPDTTLQSHTEQPPAAVEASPPAAVRTPKAKPQRPTPAKRSAGKTKTTSTARRPARSKS
jgi:hypothetical protein